MSRLALNISPSSHLTSQLVPGTHRACSTMLRNSSVSERETLKPPQTMNTTQRVSPADGGTILSKRAGWYTGTRVVEQASSTSILWSSMNCQPSCVDLFDRHSPANLIKLSMLNSSGTVYERTPPALSSAIFRTAADGCDAPNDPEARDEKPLKWATSTLYSELCTSSTPWGSDFAFLLNPLPFIVMDW